MFSKTAANSHGTSHKGGGDYETDTEVCYKIVNSSYDREATGIKSQYHGCLNKT